MEKIIFSFYFYWLSPRTFLDEGDLNDALFVIMEEIDKYNFQNFIGFCFKLRPWIYGSWQRPFNNLHSNISIHILHTVLCTFPKVLIRRICLTIKSFFKTKNFFKMKKTSFFIFLQSSNLNISLLLYLLNMVIWTLICHGVSEFFPCPTLVTRQKTSFSKSCFD